MPRMNKPSLLCWLAVVVSYVIHLVVASSSSSSFVSLEESTQSPNPRRQDHQSRPPRRFVDWINVPPPRSSRFIQQQQEHTNHVQTLYFPQRLDHFRLSDGRTFDQRYFYSNRFVHPTANHNHPNNGTVRNYAFLCVGGEGPPLDPSVLVDSVHCTGDMIELAQTLFQEQPQPQHGAGSTVVTTNIHLFALEHRYYGDSYPHFDDHDDNNNNHNTSSPLATRNLVYLSSRQALADIGHFIATIPSRHPEEDDDDSSWVWITFGGSYPGMLAAWSRWQLPHLVHGAVSSSAPVQPELDFWQYNRHVGTVLNSSDHGIGGSPTCWNVIQQGHEQLARLFSVSPVRHPTIVDQWTAMAQRFHLCNASTIFRPNPVDTTMVVDDNPYRRVYANVAVFMGDGVVSIGTQENDPACTKHELCNIAHKCHFLETQIQQYPNRKAWQHVQHLANEMWRLEQRPTNDTDSDDDHDTCINVSWQAVLDQIQDTALTHKTNGFRSWLWQTCTEFGFYQTCPLNHNKACPFARGWHVVTQDLQLCQVAFGLTAFQVQAAVQETRDYYGGREFGTDSTRILSLNGQVDPWSELALFPNNTTVTTHDMLLDGTTKWEEPSDSHRRSRRRRRSTETRTKESLPSIMIPGASHHFWTHASLPTDRPPIVAARTYIHETVRQWLLEETANANTPSTKKKKV